MRPRTLALLLTAAGVALHFAVALPARSQAMAAADAYKRLRDTRRETQTRMTAVERRAARARALEITGLPPAPAGQGVAHTRRAVIEATSRTGVADVRVSARPGVAPVVAVVRIAAKGSLREVLDLTAALVEPGNGLAVGEARYRPTTSGVDVELTLIRIGDGP